MLKTRLFIRLNIRVHCKGKFDPKECPVLSEVLPPITNIGILEILNAQILQSELSVDKSI